MKIEPINCQTVILLKTFFAEQISQFITILNNYVVYIHFPHKRFSDISSRFLNSLGFVKYLLVSLFQELQILRELPMHLKVTLHCQSNLENVTIRVKAIGPLSIPI